MEVVEKETTLRLLFEGIGWLEDPSVSRFERGRGTGVVGRIVVVGASTTCRTKRGVVGHVGQSD